MFMTSIIKGIDSLKNWHKTKTFFIVFACLGCIGLIWQMLSVLEKFEGVIPPPTSVVNYLLGFSNLKIIFQHVANTFGYVISSAVLGLFLGHVVGILSVYFRVPLVYQFGIVIKSIPVTLFIPVLFAAVGFKKAIPLLIAFPIFAMSLVNSFDASSKLSEQRRHTANFIGFDNFNYLLHIAFWESLEAFFVSARLGVMYSLSLVIAFDYFIGVIGGIGEFAKTYSDQREMTEVFAIIVIVIVIVLLLVHIMDLIGSRLVGWKYEK